MSSWIILSVKVERQEAEQVLDFFNRILHHIHNIISSPGPTSCYGIDILHGPKRSKKGNRYFVERYHQIMTHARKAVIAVNALGESSSE